MALSGSPLGKPGTAIPRCAARVVIGTSVLGPQRSTAFVKLRRETVHGEPRTVRSEGAEEAQSLLGGHHFSLEKESVRWIWE